MREQCGHGGITELLLQLRDRRQLPLCFGEPLRQAPAGIPGSRVQGGLPARLAHGRAIFGALEGLLPDSVLDQ